MLKTRHGAGTHRGPGSLFTTPPTSRSFASWLTAEGEDVAYVMDQMGHTDPSMTVGIYARAIRNGRRSAQSRRRHEALAGDADRAATGTGAPADVSQVVGELAA